MASYAYRTRGNTNLVTLGFGFPYKEVNIDLTDQPPQIERRQQRNLQGLANPHDSWFSAVLKFNVGEKMISSGPLEDRLAIRELVDSYNDAVMRKDGDAWAENWRDDATWELPGAGPITGP